jgi:hypothetical protein
MQILRRLMLACVAATFLTPVLLHAYDNEEQIRARQALEDKMKELDAQHPTTSAPPSMVTQPKPAATKAKKQKPATVPKPANSAAQAPAAQKPASPDILVTPGQPPQEVPPAQTAPSMAPAVQKPAAAAPQPVVSQPAPAASAPVAAQPAPAATYSTPPAASSGDTEETEKLRKAMHDQMMQQQQANSAATNAPGPTAQPWNQPYNSPHPEPGVARSSQSLKQRPAPSLPPLAGPPTGLSAAKQQKLDQLLQLYRADQITPQEYHDQRAKILAEP